MADSDYPRVIHRFGDFRLVATMRRSDRRIVLEHLDGTDAMKAERWVGVCEVDPSRTAKRQDATVTLPAHMASAAELVAVLVAQLASAADEIDEFIAMAKVPATGSDPQ